MSQGIIMDMSQERATAPAFVRSNEYHIGQVVYFSFVHVLGFLGIVYAFSFGRPEIIWLAVGYYFVCHFSTTLAAHRYYTHGSFKTSKAVEYIFAVIFCGVGQNSFFWWVGKHLEHHEYEDTDRDPHSPQHGFFHSHMGWTLKKEGAGLAESKFTAKFRKGRNDKYKIVMWQHRNYYWLFPLMAFGVPTLIGWCFGDLIGGFLVIGVTRLMFQYHGTWAVNSFGHTVGDRLDGFATNFGVIALFGVKAFRFVAAFTIMPVLAILTVGEVWHANHHISSAHWRLGRKWWQLDPGAYLIWILYKLGLVWDLQSPNDRLRTPMAKAGG
jgi:stearoyl-CoA desaturase (delta-9 desaturase)